MPGCGTPQTAYADVQGNAFYCRQGDFIGYDDDELMPKLVDSLGQSAASVVLAHEFGHAIQERAGEFSQPAILKKQQADCFAGAWAAHVARGEATGLKFGDAEIKQGLIAMIQVRDPVGGAGVADPNAHGSGFDRVGAFQDGFNGGPARCKTFFTENREKDLIDIPFDPADANSGNLPVRDPTGNNVDIVTLVPKDLDRFWTNEMTKKGVAFTPPTLQLFPEAGPLPTCNGVVPNALPKNVTLCSATNQILVDQVLVERLDATHYSATCPAGTSSGRRTARQSKRQRPANSPARTAHC
ncbi:MAG: neutral zinc metallopeptidase [Acidimicrobiales bacterium]